MASQIITKFKVEGTAQYNQKVQGAKKELDNFASSTLSLNGQLTNGIKALTGYVGAFMALSQIIENNIKTAKEFEKSVSGLSAITGMQGEALEDLKKKAIDLGGASTQTASQVVEAFKLIGSQKPELLKDAEALNEVTKAAITLAEAAGMAVPEAATALTAALNIMGEGADQAARYINVLGAASKEGSVDINGLKDIIFKAGQAATLNGLSFEQFIAVAETIGPSFGSAAEAGTALNAMLLKLQTQTNDKFKPSVVGLAEALKNLDEANLTAKESTQLVTETGYKALVPLLKNKEALTALTEAITGTSTAEEQAKINTDNFDGALSQLSSAWEKLNLSINDSNGMLTDFIKLLTKAIGYTEQLYKHIEQGYAASGEWVDDFRKAFHLTKSSNTSGGGGGAGAWGEEYQTERRDMIDGTGSKQRVTAKGGYVVVTDKNGNVIRQGHVDDLNKPEPTPTVTPTTTSKVSKKESWSSIAMSSSTANSTMISTGMASIADTKRKIAYWTKMYEEAGDDAGRAYAQKMIESRQKTLEYLQGGGMANIQKITMPDDIIQLPEVGEEVKESWEDAASAIGAVGSALANIQDPAVRVMGIIGEAIANIALGFAKATAADSELGTFGWIAAVAGGLGTMLSTISAIKSATEYHAGGGFVGRGRGTDVVNTWLTPGELVLNRAQQSNLAAGLSQNNLTNLQLETKVSGRDLRIILNNDTQSRGMGTYKIG